LPLAFSLFYFLAGYDTGFRQRCPLRAEDYDTQRLMSSHDTAVGWSKQEQDTLQHARKHAYERTVVGTATEAGWILIKVDESFVTAVIAQANIM
jgi:hypothetical protein